MMTRRIGLRRWIGHSGRSAMIAAQFGLAMIPLWHAISSGLISGTTSGTAGFMRNAAELSIITAPLRTAIGASDGIAAGLSKVGTRSVSIAGRGDGCPKQKAPSLSRRGLEDGFVAELSAQTPPTPAGAGFSWSCA